MHKSYLQKNDAINIFNLCLNSTYDFGLFLYLGVFKLIDKRAMVLQENWLWNCFTKSLDFCVSRFPLFVDCIHQCFLVSFSYNYDKGPIKKKIYLSKIILLITVKIHSGDDKVFSFSLPFRVTFRSATQI